MSFDKSFKFGAENQTPKTTRKFEPRSFERLFRKSISDRWMNLTNDNNSRLGKFIVQVPYDADTQIIDSSVNNGKFKVHVTNDPSKNNYEICDYTHESTIPTKFIEGTITQKYLSDRKKMLFIFKENSSNNEEKIGNVDELIESINATSATTEEKTNNEYEIELMVDDENVNTNTEEVNATIKKLYDEGYTYRHIASQVGLSDTTVARRVKKMLSEESK
jgi:uncharacterized protein YerC